MGINERDSIGHKWEALLLVPKSSANDLVVDAYAHSQAHDQLSPLIVLILTSLIILKNNQKIGAKKKKTNTKMKSKKKMSNTNLNWAIIRKFMGGI